MERILPSSELKVFSFHILPNSGQVVALGTIDCTGFGSGNLAAPLNLGLDNKIFLLLRIGIVGNRCVLAQF